MRVATPFVLLVLALGACGGPSTETTADGGGPTTTTDGAVGPGPDAGAPDGSVPPKVTLGPNDVSALFLGTAKGGAELTDFLPLSADGANGQLFPKAHFDALLPAMGTQFLAPEEHDDYASWAIVGMRIDPCAKDRAADAACRREVRLIAQPKTKPRSLNAGPFEDDTLHLAYHLDEGQFARALEGLVRIYETTGGSAFLGRPLGVHPLIERDGNGGAYATALKSWILAHAGNARLRRVTANFSSANLTWFLRSFTVQNDALTAAPVPCSPNPSQAWSFSGASGSSNGPTLPVPNCKTETNLMVRTQTQSQFQALTPAERASVTTEALQLLRPDLRMPGDTDCVSCHETSQGLATWHGAAFLTANDGNPARYTARPIPVAPAAVPTTTTNMRAFGYFQNQATVSLRTAIETAEVLRFLAP
jgi:hypothetical protein